MLIKKTGKTERKKIFLFLVLFFAGPVILSGKPSRFLLAPLLGNHMVLQRETTVPLWGKAGAGKKVTVIPSWSTRTYVTMTDDQGRWKIFIKTGKAGGPYNITLSTSDTTILLEDILLGEVWICSGQSNMEMPVKGFEGQDVIGGNEAIALATNYPEIRLFQVQRAVSDRPAENCSGRWRNASSASVADFSAVGWFFGAFLYRVLHVPVGLIQSTWGGTPAEVWTSMEKIRSFPDIDPLKGVVVSSAYGPLKPSALFNAMIHPLIPFRIKGVIWYQGESNIHNPELYSRLFPALIDDWRKQWGYDFPFYFVQIAPCIWGGDLPRQSALLREAQLQTMLNTPHTGMVVTLDVGDSLRIHPARKKEVGQRLAYWALAKDYGFEQVGYTAPVYKSVSFKDTLALIFFSHLNNGIAERTTDELKGSFEIAGKDSVFYPAEARIREWKDFVEVWSDKVKKPVAVRYCFKKWCVGKLFGTNGLPVSSFRTDRWEIPKFEK